METKAKLEQKQQSCRADDYASNKSSVHLVTIRDLRHELQQAMKDTEMYASMLEQGEARADPNANGTYVTRFCREGESSRSRRSTESHGS